MKPTKIVYETLDVLLKRDMWDIIKVNVANGVAVIAAKSDVISINSIIQETGTSLLILASAGYTLYKFIHMYRTTKWAKQDRIDEIDNREEDENP